MRESDLKDRLARAARSLEVQEAPVERIMQRGRHLRLRRVIAVAVSVAVIGSGLTWGLESVAKLGREQRRPAAEAGIARISLDGRSPIRHMAIGEGAAWVIAGTVGTGRTALVRIDATTNHPEDVPGVGQPQGVAVGGSSIWVVSCFRSDALGCVDTRVLKLDRTGRVEVTTRVQGMTFGAITYGFGAAWVGVNQPGATRARPQILRVAPTGGVVATITGCCLGDVVAAAGSVWGIDSLNTRVVRRIDPASNKFVAVIDADAYILAGDEQEVWAIDERDVLERIDPLTDQIVTSIPDLGGASISVAQGYLWLARCPGEFCMEVFRVDPRSNQIVQPARVIRPFGRGVGMGHFGNTVLTIGVGEGSVWIGSERQDQVVRVPIEFFGTGPSPSPSTSTSPVPLPTLSPTRPAIGATNLRPGFLQRRVVSSSRDRLVIDSPLHAARWTFHATSCSVDVKWLDATGGGGFGGSGCAGDAYLSYAVGSVGTNGALFTVVAGRTVPEPGVQVSLTLAKGDGFLVPARDGLWMVVVQRCGNYAGTGVTVIEARRTDGTLLGRIELPRDPLQPPC